MTPHYITNNIDFAFNVGLVMLQMTGFEYPVWFGFCTDDKEQIKHFQPVAVWRVKK